LFLCQGVTFVASIQNDDASIILTKQSIFLPCFLESPVEMEEACFTTTAATTAATTDATTAACRKRYYKQIRDEKQRKSLPDCMLPEEEELGMTTT
jgi:hypothetical protein